LKKKLFTRENKGYIEDFFITKDNNYIILVKKPISLFKTQMKLSYINEKKQIRWQQNYLMFRNLNFSSSLITELSNNEFFIVSCGPLNNTNYTGIFFHRFNHKGVQIK